MRSEETPLDHWLINRYGYEKSLLTARGASAIYVLLRALDRAGTAVLVPAITCPAAIYPIVAAGYQPVFCDITLTDFNIDTAALDGLPARRDISAVLAVHSYGHRLDTSALRSWCDRQSALLIEDICQFGGDPEFDAVGDALVTSFGATKLLDVGYGGALLTNDRSLHLAARQIESSLPERRHRQTDYRAAYQSLQCSVTAGETHRGEFGQLGQRYIDLFVHRLNAASALAATVMPETGNLTTEIAHRRRRHQAYASALADLPLDLPTIAESSVPWRFTFCTRSPSTAISLTGTLRDAGFHASNWYRALPADWAYEEDLHPNASAFETTVINLWLAEGAGDTTVKRTCELLHRFFNGTTDSGRPIHAL